MSAVEAWKITQEKRRIIEKEKQEATEEEKKIILSNILDRARRGRRDWAFTCNPERLHCEQLYYYLDSSGYKVEYQTSDGYGPLDEYLFFVKW